MLMINQGATPKVLRRVILSRQNGSVLSWPTKTSSSELRPSMMKPGLYHDFC